METTMPTAVQVEEMITPKKKFLTKLNGVDLSFSGVREFERTKHVHRLHPYLGKFIPQLVELFLKHYFKKGDWILDPFMGSGTTLIEANILGMNSVGVEISAFNCHIARVKVKQYNIPEVEREIKDILYKTKNYSNWLRNKEKELFPSYYKKYEAKSDYFNTWFAKRAINEIFFYRDQIKNYENQDILKVILSRATRSARQIPHYDLARPSKPVKSAYYCIKYRRTCEPIEEALKFINRYSWDTIKRIKEFDKIRWGLERRYELPRIVMGKYLKMLYICHECRETLDKSDLNLDGEFNLLDLGHIFPEPCDPEKVKSKI